MGHDQVHPLPLALLIYADLTAAISILLVLNWLFSWTHHLPHFSVDFCMSAMWFIAFALLVKYMGATSCAAKPFDWSRIAKGGLCNQFKTCAALSFFWWLSSGIGRFLDGVVGLEVVSTEAVHNLDIDVKNAVRKLLLERNKIVRFTMAHLSWDEVVSSHTRLVSRTIEISLLES